MGQATQRQVGQSSQPTATVNDEEREKIQPLQNGSSASPRDDCIPDCIQPRPVTLLGATATAIPPGERGNYAGGTKRRTVRGSEAVARLNGSSAGVKGVKVAVRNGNARVLARVCAEGVSRGRCRVVVGAPGKGSGAR